MDFAGNRAMSGGGIGGSALMGMAHQIENARDIAKESAVAAQLSVLMSRAEELAMLAARLEQRISGALTPTPPTPAQTGPSTNAPMPISGQLAMGLLEINQRLYGTARHLDSILDRVEL